MLRKLLAVGGAVLLLGLAASSSVAAPTYTGWSAPVNLGPVVNSSATELGPALSADGLSLFFFSGRPGGLGGNDIWVTHRTSTTAAWGVPADVGPGVNSASVESVPALSADGHWMFFGSDRPGGSGGTDLYQSYRADIHDDFGWQAATNLGSNVNSAVEDNGPGYFDNGGHPQIYFGSNRPGAAGTDIYRSDRQPDGSWGPAAPVPELNSPSTENRFNIRQDGLEVFFYSDRTGTFGGSDLWVATRATTDAPWSTPVNVGSSINTSASEQHPSLSADGRTLFFGSNRAGGSGGADLYVTTRSVELTVTANDQSRLFGQANPPLSYAITGFVGGETSSVVSGTASCSAAALPFSPAGGYPITCAVGTLGAAGYVFSSFVTGTLTVTHTSPCLTGFRSGPLTVAAGETACIGAGGVQSGPVTVRPGGSLDLEGGTIVGPVTATAAAVVRLCGASLTGPLTISGSTGLVLVGGDDATGPCDPNAISGPVRVTDNTGGIELNGNTVVGPLRITGNTGSLPPPDTGPVRAVGNTVTGPVTIQP
jgi:hypothetical protein